MRNFEETVTGTLTDFAKVAALAGIKQPLDKIVIEIGRRPHRAPTSLPIGRMAVYAFFLEGRALKVGMVGANSGPRYTSQHYNPGSAQSTLAKSILSAPANVGATGIDAASIGLWIKTNTDRVNLLVPATFGVPVLALLEAFLHVRWKPMFEGRAERA